MTLKSFIIKFNSSQAQQEVFTPERALMIAVLKRAFFDLAPEVHHSIRNDAITWFKGREATVTFQDCLCALDMGSAVIAAVMKKVFIAETLYGPSKPK